MILWRCCRRSLRRGKRPTRTAGSRKKAASAAVRSRNPDRPRAPSPAGPRSAARSPRATRCGSDPTAGRRPAPPHGVWEASGRLPRPREPAPRAGRSAKRPLRRASRASPNARRPKSRPGFSSCRPRRPREFRSFHSICRLASRPSARPPAPAPRPRRHRPRGGRPSWPADCSTRAGTAPRAGQVWNDSRPASAGQLGGTARMPISASRARRRAAAA